MSVAVAVAWQLSEWKDDYDPTKEYVDSQKTILGRHPRKLQLKTDK